MSYDLPMKKIIVFLLLPVLLGACASQSPPANFYVLTPLSQPGNRQLPGKLIGVGPVNLADYLDRNQLVSRSGEVSLKLDEFNRWAGGLDGNITRVVAENLSRLLGISGVLAYPWSSAVDLDYQIILDISRFDIAEGNRVILDVQWQLFDQEKRKLVSVQRKRFEIQAKEPTRASSVLAQSEALARLAEALAQSLKSAQGDE
ncbi:PqiC family protein [Thiolapillus sp.]